MGKALASLLIVVALTTGARAGDKLRITQKDWKFHPNSVELSSGGEIEVTNDDPRMHHLYIDSPRMDFDSGEQPPGKTVVIRFPRPGDYEVLCAIHPKMRLHVKVK